MNTTRRKQGRTDAATTNEVLQDEREEPRLVTLLPESVPVLIRDDEVRPRDLWATVEGSEPTAYGMNLDRYEELLVDRLDEGIARELSTEEYEQWEDLDPVYLFPSLRGDGTWYVLDEWTGTSEEDEA